MNCRVAATGLGLALTAAPSLALADSWTREQGEGIVILKYEPMRAEEGFDPDGSIVDLPAPRTDETVAVFAEYGVTPTLTVRFRGELQRGEDAFVDYEGAGPVELGVNWQVYRDDRSAVSLYAAYAHGGEGRNAGYAQPGEGEADLEVRVAAGRSWAPKRRWLRPNRMFAEVQAARRFREGLADEVRVDVTVGGHYGDGWMVLNQLYGGVSDNGSQWLSSEASVVRRLGAWNLQAGWRQTIAGRETPLSGGPVIALWRRF